MFHVYIILLYYNTYKYFIGIKIYDISNFLTRYKHLFPNFLITTSHLLKKFVRVMTFNVNEFYDHDYIINQRVKKYKRKYNDIEHFRLY